MAGTWKAQAIIAGLRDRNAKPLTWEKTNMSQNTTATTSDTSIITLIDGYTKKPAQFRVITFDEVRAWATRQASPCTFCGPNGTIPITITNEFQVERFKLPIGTEHSIVCGGCNGTKTKLIGTTPSHVWFIDTRGQARTAKVNGKVRTWKRDLTRIEIPLKYGLYEYVTFDASDIRAGRLIQPL